MIFSSHKSSGAKTNHSRSLSRVILSYLKIILLGLVLFGAAMIIFIKLDTPAAAELTDNYLRPIFGDSKIIFLENIYFNFSDSIESAAYKFKKPAAPQFLGQSQSSVLPSSLDLKPLSPNPAFTPLDGEGVWRNLPLAVFPDREVMADTFIRPDSARNYAIVTVVRMDTSLLELGSVAGIKQPGGPVGKPGPGRVPDNIVQSGNLVAAFEGGFQYRDGEYGMIAGNTVYLPLKNNLGTIVGYKDGSVKIFNYTGQPLGNNAEFARQNGPMLIENGNITVTNPDNRKVWGRTIGGNTYTWRSGIGIAKTGDLVYAVGNNLSPLTLATALEVAGAVNAIQLDINPYWVRFNIFNRTGPGQYSSYPLIKEMQDGSRAYLNGYSKDFFYAYKKT